MSSLYFTPLLSTSTSLPRSASINFFLLLTPPNHNFFPSLKHPYYSPHLSLISIHQNLFLLACRGIEKHMTWPDQTSSIYILDATMTTMDCTVGCKPKKRMEFDEPHTGLVKSDFFGYWYLQYCLITGLYMLEPWERKMFNTFVFSLLAMICTFFYAIYWSF